jgi:hypothetical protein
LYRFRFSAEEGEEGEDEEEGDKSERIGAEGSKEEVIVSRLMYAMIKKRMIWRIRSERSMMMIKKQKNDEIDALLRSIKPSTVKGGPVSVVSKDESNGGHGRG